jgi:AcrR family transcriptional regulator
MTPRSGAQPESVGGERPRRSDAVRNREAIVDAAIRVLADRPGASMAEIATASGMARATIYRHFADRGDLVTAIQIQATEAGAAALADADLDSGSATDALSRAVRALVGVGDRYRLLASEAALSPDVLESRPAVAGRLFSVVERGQRDGEFRRDLPPHWIVAALASQLVLALRGMAAESLTQQEAAARVASMLVDGIATAESVE